MIQHRYNLIGPMFWFILLNHLNNAESKNVEGKNVESQKRRKYKCGMVCVFGWMREAEDLTHPSSPRPHPHPHLHSYPHTHPQPTEPTANHKKTAGIKRNP